MMFCVFTNIKNKRPEGRFTSKQMPFVFIMPSVYITNTFSKQIRKLWIISQAIQQFVSGLNNVNNTANDW